MGRRRKWPIGRLAAVAVAAVLAVTSWRVLKIRYTAYAFRVKQDSAYDFSKSEAVRVACTLAGGTVGLPDAARKYDTGFLRVRVNVPLAGYVLQPRVEVSGGGTATSEAVEYGASGIRYLNVSKFLGTGAKQLRVAGLHAAVEDAPVELVLFANPPVRNARVLVLAPHPDDAEIAAYGLYSDAAQAWVVTVTAGEANDVPGEIPAAERERYLLKGRVRVWDSVTVPSWGGVPPDRCVNLGYFDDTLKTMHSAKDTPVASRSTGLTDPGVFRQQNLSTLLSGRRAVATWNSLVSDLGELVARIRPDVIVAPYPAIDYNSDHKYATLALLEALRAQNTPTGPTGRLYLYTNHYTLTDYYPFGVEGDPITLPPVLGRPLAFRGLCSHPLDERKIRDKVYALDGMHDLRPEPSWRTVAGAFETLCFLVKGKIYGRDYSYYRRAARSNELFFVVPIREAVEGDTCRRLLGDEGRQTR